MSEQNATDEEVERVARAMFEDDNPRNDHWSPSWGTIRDKYVDGPPSHCRDYWRQKARAAIEAMKESRAATERWAAFGRAVMAQHKGGDCGDVDGGWLQETGVQTGVLQIVEAKEPCAEEGCMCAATCGDWPVDCYRVVTP